MKGLRHYSPEIFANILIKLMTKEASDGQLRLYPKSAAEKFARGFGPIYSIPSKSTSLDAGCILIL